MVYDEPYASFINLSLILFRKKDLAGEEVLVLNHIQAAGNEGHSEFSAQDA